mmetsp:Transcript_8606/g.12696  ORF Transcript_8606/g.12696 Transcript_8606/m.12696 type:complete len:728 (-) Transcript_8606:35-2218(-)
MVSRSRKAKLRKVANAFQESLNNDRKKCIDIHTGICRSCHMPCSINKHRIILSECNHELCLACIKRKTLCAECELPVDDQDFLLPSRIPEEIRRIQHLKQMKKLEKEKQKDSQKLEPIKSKRKGRYRSSMKNNVEEETIGEIINNQMRFQREIKREREEAKYKKMREARLRRERHRQKQIKKQQRIRKQEQKQKAEEQRQQALELAEIRTVEEQFENYHRHKIKTYNLQKLTVGVRLYPVDAHHQKCVTKISNQNLNVCRTIPAHIESGERNEWLHFHYDHIWNGMDSVRDTLHKHIGKKIVQCAVNGLNSCCLAYGQTGSGKTHTIFGPTFNHDDALIPLIAKELFEELAERYENRWTLRVSFIEIYNEKTRDLITQRSSYLSDSIYENSKGEVIVKGVKKHKVHNFRELMNLINVGRQTRQTDSTSMNIASSRSHGVVTFQIQYWPLAKRPKYMCTSVCNIVDLAGFERVGRVLKPESSSYSSKVVGEGIKINQSLLQLGICLKRLSEITQQSEKGMVDSSKDYVSTRGSTLTWMLRNSLMGNSKMFMVATVNPSTEYVNESLTTLYYASQSMNITTPCKRNPIMKTPLWTSTLKDLFNGILRAVEEWSDCLQLQVSRFEKSKRYRHLTIKVKKAVNALVNLLHLKIIEYGRENVAETLEEELMRQHRTCSREKFNRLLVLIISRFTPHYWDFIDQNELEKLRQPDDDDIVEGVKYMDFSSLSIN